VSWAHDLARANAAIDELREENAQLRSALTKVHDDLDRAQSNYDALLAEIEDADALRGGGA